MNEPGNHLDQKATVSIIIPCYNHGHYLPYAVRSVLAQTFPDWEAIIVDDGSTDDTRQVAAQFTDPRIRTIYQENRGLSAARNTGIRAAQGVYLAFLDSDDSWDPGFLAVMTDAFGQYPEAAFVYCGIRFMDAQGRELPRIAPAGSPPRDYSTAVAEIRSFLVHSVLCRKTDVISAGLFDETLTSCEDWDLWIRLIKLVGSPVPIERLLAWYRLSSRAMSTHSERMLLNIQRVIGKHSEPGSRLRGIAQASAHFITAVDYLMKDERSATVDHLKQAQRSDPLFYERPSLYYELLCGSQPKGHRGIVAELHLVENLEYASALLQDALLADDSCISKVDPRVVHEHLLLTATQMAWQQGNPALMRTLIWRAIRAKPGLIGESRTWRSIIKAMVGQWLPHYTTTVIQPKGPT